MGSSRKFVYRKFDKPQAFDKRLLQVNQDRFEELTEPDRIQEDLLIRMIREMQYKVSEYLPEGSRVEWEDTGHVASCMTEELVFKVEEDCLDDYLKVDYEIWTKLVGASDGFMGKETWISSKTGLVTSIIYWESKKQPEDIDQVV